MKIVWLSSFLLPTIAAFVVLHRQQQQRPPAGLARSPLSFKQRAGKDDVKAPWWASFKSRMASLFGQPQPDAGQRFHIRIKAIGALNRRHVITRLTRYFPDLTFETASDIVDTALINDIALVRVTNSKQEAAFATEMLRKADPPIPAEIYDERTDEVLIL
jgi:hypothetical protein